MTPKLREFNQRRSTKRWRARFNRKHILSAEALCGIPELTLRILEKYLHALIQKRAGDLVRKHRLALPKLSSLISEGRAAGQYVVPGMCGGFDYWLWNNGRAIVLRCESHCRVVGGSDQRHIITTRGAILVEDGYM